MPIMTMLVMRRSAVGAAQSPSASRASITWPRISADVRLRTSRMVPVWQKRQFRVQPTWLETHSVPRSSSGMKTVSISDPSASLSSHLRVPSVEVSAVTTSGREMRKCSASRARRSFAMLVMAAKSVAPR